MPAPRMRFEPGDVDGARPTIEELTDRYDARCRARDPQLDVVDVSNLQMVLEWKVGWVDGWLDEWVSTDVEEFLLEWCPRKLSAPADIALEMAESVADAFTFLGEEGLLSAQSQPAQVLAAETRALAPEFFNKMSDPANFGMTKSMFAGMGVDLSEEMTQDRLNELTQQFNALSYEQRAAITDPFISEAKPDRPVIGPVVLPTEEEVRESAAASPVLTGFKALCAYFEAPGRPLTAKGNIKLADAGALSALLGSEPLEEDFGQHTFRRHSSASMPSLDHWQWWARQTGAIRVAKGRMVEVKAWSRRCEQDPVGEATKAFEILMSHGVVGSYLTYGLSSGPEVIDNAAGSLLAMILASRDPLDFTTLVDAVLRIRKEMGVRPAFGDDEIDAEFVSSDVNLMLTMLERAGVLVQHDAVFEKARLSERRTGGTVTLTPFGVRMAVGEAETAGMGVETVDSPEDLDVKDLADMAMDQVVDVDAWFRLLVSWMGLPENGRPALMRLFDALDGDTLLVVLALQTPDELVEDFAAVLDEALGTRPADDLVAAAAINWLSEHERLDPARVSPERMDLSRITVLCQVASNDPAAVAEMMGATRTREESLADVAAAVRLMPPRVEALLDAIGRNHPDKVVAKSARRENLRVRSRLANQRRG